MSDAGALLRSVRKRGLRGTFNFARREIIRRYKLRHSLDRTYGLDTEGIISINSFHIDSGNARHGGDYQPIARGLFAKLMKLVPADISGWTFIDFGSGKGRALILASDYPFGKIIGVEFVPEFHAIAVQNIKIYRSRKQRCFDIEAICMDAAKFEVPNTPTLYYFYNPFDDAVMKAVLGNIKLSLAKTPRDHFFAYCHPVQAKTFDDMQIPKERIILLDADTTTDPAWRDL